jgi:hypothetical protein
MSVINNINVRQWIMCKGSSLTIISLPPNFETVTISIIVMLRMRIKYVLAVYLKTCVHVLDP